MGIEEEYLLVDKQTRDLVTSPPDSLMEEAVEACESRSAPEFLESQIEIGTRVCSNMTARVDLVRLRRSISDMAASYGLAPIAASTIPSPTGPSSVTRPRRDTTRPGQQDPGSAHEMLICGMHVHVGVEDDAQRIDLMNQLTYSCHTCWR